MDCLKCGGHMVFESQEIKKNKITKKVFRCPKCGDRIIEDEEQKWVKL
jgi:DNA-directed RNA polymerase subunit RPC12/RpoP